MKGVDLTVIAAQLGHADTRIKGRRVARRISPLPNDFLKKPLDSAQGG